MELKDCISKAIDELPAVVDPQEVGRILCAIASAYADDPKEMVSFVGLAYLMSISFARDFEESEGSTKH